MNHPHSEPVALLSRPANDPQAFGTLKLSLAFSGDEKALLREGCHLRLPPVQGDELAEALLDCAGLQLPATLCVLNDSNGRDRLQSFLALGIRGMAYRGEFIVQLYGPELSSRAVAGRRYVSTSLRLGEARELSVREASGRWEPVKANRSTAQSRQRLDAAKQAYLDALQAALHTASHDEQALSA